MAFIKVISGFLTRLRQAKASQNPEASQQPTSQTDPDDGVTVFR